MTPAQISILALGLGALATAAGLSPAEGDWLGTLSFNGVHLRLALHIKTSPGGLTGTLDSIDQGAKGMPLDHISLRENKLTLQVPSVHGSYEGVVADRSITGTWSQGGAALPLEFKRTTEPLVLKRPQEPKPPFPYVSEEVGYDNPQAAGVHLAGTLTKPKGEGPFPAVLLITGSGAQNRDEEIFGHKPFFVLADYLTRRGIAVLRVDDRGVGGSTGNFKTSTTEDFAGDVMAGVRYLLSRPDIDKKHVGLVGHSEGGIVAPMTAVKMGEVAFIVMLAGSAVPGDQVIADQVYQANIQAGATAEIAAQSRDFELKLLAIDKNESDPALREKKILAMAEGNANLQKRIKDQLPALTSPWYRYFISYDPRPVLAQVKCPVLALNGAKDRQVDAALNVPVIQAILKEAGNLDATAQIVPGVNHLFQNATSGAVGEYGTIEETMSPQVLDTIAAWIQRHSTN